MNNVITLLKLTIAMLPTIFVAWRCNKVNLKKPYRSRQILMPVVALIYVIMVIVFIGDIMDLCAFLAELLARGLRALADLIAKINVEFIQAIAEKIRELAESLLDAVAGSLMYVIMAILNFVVFAVFVVLKRIITLICKKVFVSGNVLFDMIAPLFYEEGENDIWYVRRDTIQARKYMKAFFVGSVVITGLLMYISMFLYAERLLQMPFFPVLGIIVIGELFYYINGDAREEVLNQIDAENDVTRSIYNYVALRKILRRLFGDKLGSDDTSVRRELEDQLSVEQLLDSYRSDSDRMVETYGHFMKKYRDAKHELDRNYLASGLALLRGQSILFSNPFYHDLIPYAFYAMNHKLLQHKKVLVILGRHGIEDDIIDWCRKGLRSVSNVEGLWRIGVMSETSTDLDVGIITRSGVQNLKLHRTNVNFFLDTEFVMIIEPSKLISTAQVGLNSIVRFCRQKEGKEITFCSTDKNCDGLVDALSHALMTSLSEVSATEAHKGVCSYMVWNADQDHLQHRMLPNIARYLGIGTELSFVALKNQVSETHWYGGDAFPVVDAHWIAKQYYSELLDYANLAVNQTLMDSVFRSSANLWNAPQEKKAYLTVEDEAHNIFEMKRDFATRATGQSFVNVITAPYLLCDYMNSNNEIFNADPKAIPYIVADYVITRRNVLLRIFAQMAAYYMWEQDVRRELLLADICEDDLRAALWKSFCACFNPIENGRTDGILTVVRDGREYAFTADVISRRSRYDVVTGKDGICYTIDDESFINVMMGDMASSRYLAEDESENAFIGTELKGQVFQKYLPGQFFTLCGKYYEMISTTYDGRVLLRRAADHITGRPVYRQVRKYSVRATAPDPTMGSDKTFNGMHVTRQYADISVSTPAYWQMDAYNDFEKAVRVDVNNVPDREYTNKWILRIDFDAMGDAFTDRIRTTVTALFNEIFRTLFAENQDLIIATTDGEPGIPLTYGLSGEAEDYDPRAIYIIEDSQYDIGLLTAVERNLNRIFQIMCEYLEWNDEEIEKARNGQEKTFTDYRITDEERAAEEKLPREKKGNIFSRIGRKISAFFRRLFGRKKKEPKETPVDGTKETPIGEPTEIVVDGTAEIPEETGFDVTVDEMPEMPEEIPAESDTPSDEAAEHVSEAEESKAEDQDSESGEGDPESEEEGSEVGAEPSFDAEPGQEGDLPEIEDEEPEPGQEDDLPEIEDEEPESGQEGDLPEAEDASEIRITEEKHDDRS